MAIVLEVTTKDIQREVFVILKYQIDPATGILGRSASIENRTKDPLTIMQAAAAAWTLPRAPDYELSYLTGRWGSEFNVQREKVRPGQRVLESRRGSTGHQNNPWFAISRGETQEQTGDVWFGALAWSGSWRITVETSQIQQVRITGGLQPLRLQLSPRARRQARHARLLWWLHARRNRRSLPPDASF